MRAILAVWIPLLLAGMARADRPPLIPRDALFPKPAAMQAIRLSPDGRLISYLAADPAGVQQLWVRDVDRGTVRRLTDVPAPGVVSYEWVPGSRFVCYGRHNATGQQLIAFELASGRERTVVAIDGAEFSNIVTRAGVPDALLLAVKTRGAEDADIYRLDVDSGRLALDTKNPGGIPDNWFYADETLTMRAVQRVRGDGGTELLVRDGPSGAWRPWLGADTSHTLSVEGFTGDGEALLLRTDLDADTAGIVSWKIRDREQRVVARTADLDVYAVLRHARTGSVQAVAYLADPLRWEAIDPSLAADFRLLGRLERGTQFAVASRDVADKRWLVWLSRDNGPPQLYLWDRATRKTRLVFDDRPHLRGFQFAHVRPLAITARDGLRLHAYLTTPPGIPARQLPLVVWVHGGPTLRDAWGFDHIGQLFANRGYAFLRVNFRGSSGYGRAFRLAGRKQWGRAMQHDVEDAVDAVVRSGVAERSRMAIIGHSYGGYSALVGLSLTPDRFACGAASSTVADLVAFAAAFPRTPENAWVREAVGDVLDAADLAVLRSVSPITFVDRVTKPVLIARGGKDGIAPSGIDAFVERIRARGGEAASVVYEGDGHFFSRQNELDYFARVEALFARCLGGRAEPMAGRSGTR